MRLRDWLVPALGVAAVGTGAGAVALSQSSSPPPVVQPLGAIATAPTPIPPTTCQFNNIQTVAITGVPTGGTFNLSLDGGTSGADITPNYTVTSTTGPSASTLHVDIGNLPATMGGSAIGGSNVVVTGTYPTYQVTFSGAIKNVVNVFNANTAFMGGTLPKVKFTVVPTDQTNQFQNLVNKQPDNSTLKLDPGGCWEIDGSLSAGNLSDAIGGDLTSNLYHVTGGSITTPLSTSVATTTINISTTGSTIIPSGSNIFLSETVGSNTHSFTFVTNGSTPASNPTITVNSLLSNFAYDSTATVLWASAVTNLFVNTSGFTTINPGTSIQVSDIGSSNNQTFVTSGTVTPDSTTIPVNSLLPNFPYQQGLNNTSVSPPFTTLPVTGSAYFLPAGSNITVTGSDDAHRQSFTTATDSPIGDTSLSLTGGAHFSNWGGYDTDATTFAINHLHISNHTHLTIDGNGASLVQTECQPSDVGGAFPILPMSQDTNLTIENLTLTGAYNWPRSGCTGIGHHGPAFEKNAGLFVEAETNLTIRHVGVFNAQGDGMDLQPANDFGLSPGPLNTNILVTQSTFDGGGGGYHGLVGEAVGPTATCPDCGATFNSDYWIRWPTEMMDFEVDIGQTGFNTGTGCTSLPGGLCPTVFAQDNVKIQNSYYTAWSAPWFTSLQGAGTGIFAGNGIQEQNLSFTGNLLNNVNVAGTGGSAFMQVNVHSPTVQGPSGSPPTTIPSVPPQYWTQNWTISNNTETGPYGFKPVAGGSCTDNPPHPTAFFKGIVNMTITNNVFPVSTNDCSDTPWLVFAQVQDTHYSSITHNQFFGAKATLNAPPAGNNKNFVFCSNSVGAASGPVYPGHEAAC